MANNYRGNAKRSQIQITFHSQEKSTLINCFTITFQVNSAIPSTAMTADAENMRACSLPLVVLRRDLDSMACHIDGTTAKLHMNSTIALRSTGKIVSPTMVTKQRDKVSKNPPIKICNCK